MGTYDQEITAIEEQINRNEMPAAEDVLWLCRNLRHCVDRCQRLDAELTAQAVQAARVKMKEMPRAEAIREDA